MLPGKVRTPLPVFANGRLWYRARLCQALCRYLLGQGKAFSYPTPKHIRICPRRRIGGPGCPLTCALSPQEGRGQAALALDARTRGASPAWCFPSMVLPQHGASQRGAPPARHGRAPAGFAIPVLQPGTGTVRQPGPSPCHTSGLLPLLRRKAAQGFPLGAHPREIKMKLEWDMGHFVFGAVPAPGKR